MRVAIAEMTETKADAASKFAPNMRDTTDITGGDHAPTAAKSAVPNTTPPIAPSMVFLGLIVGASRCRPASRPV